MLLRLPATRTRATVTFLFPVLLLILLSGTFGASAQSTYSYDSSFNTQMDTIFDSLNTSKVPFGILRDFAMEFANLAAYNGLVIADSTKTTYATVKDIYNTLASGVISTNAGSMVHPIYFDSVWQTQRQAGVITLAGLFYQYAAFSPNSVDSGLITIANNKVTDKYVNGVWQNPYVTQNVFAISPSINSYNTYGTYALQVVLPANTWLSNSASLISSMSVDFADGLGSRVFTTSQLYSLAYSSGGTKTWSFTLKLTNGAVLQSRTDIQLDSVAKVTYNFMPGRGSSLAGANRPAKWYLPFGGGVSKVMPIQATTPMYGEYAAGYITILYANADQKIRNPLIIAEGFDAGDVLKPEVATGEQTLYDFTQQLRNGYASDADISPNFSNMILSGSYDIIYVDWKHGTDFIERNAMLLEQVIAWVNKTKITTNSNIIIGQSMGALVTRYALKDMENKSVNHQTTLFISWDGPHQGANVPLAYQYMSRQARSLYIKTTFSGVFNFYSTFIHPSPSSFVGTVQNLNQLYAGSPYAIYYPNVYVGNIVDAGLNLQDFPAAREMLINFLTPTPIPTLDNSIHSSWQSTLTSMGYPVGFSGAPLKVVAVSDGSECGTTEPFSPGQALLDVRGNSTTTFLGELLGTFALPFAAPLIGQPSLFLAALPGNNQFNVRFSCYAQPNQTSAQQYVGTVSYTKKVLWLIPVTTYWTNWNVYANASILPYDYFPGGMYPVPVNLTNQSFHNSLVEFQMTVNANVQTFDFVPVPSALDIGSNKTTLGLSDYLTEYVGAFPPAAPKNTPFSAFVTAFDLTTPGNEYHIAPTWHNGNWVYAQITGPQIVDNCSFECSSLTISGSNKLCTGSQTYTLPGINAPDDAQVTWSASPAGLVTLTPNGTQVTLKWVSNGTVTLQAIATSASCGQTVSGSMSIQVGAPSTAGINGTPGSCSGSTQSWTLAATPVSDGSNWRWSVGHLGNNSSIYINNPTSSTTTISVTGGGVVDLNYTDNCGNPESTSITVYAQCMGGEAMMAVAPNPTTGMVTLSAANATTKAAAEVPGSSGQSTMVQKIYRVNVCGVAGNQLKQFGFPAGATTVNLDLTSLPNGTYILQIFDNNNRWTTQQVVILK